MRDLDVRFSTSKGRLAVKMNDVANDDDRVSAKIVAKYHGSRSSF